MAAMSAERNLLFGLLALQNGLIDQGQLVAAFQAWTRERARPLAEHLANRGDLDPDQRAGVETMVRLHLNKYGGSAEKSLAAFSAGRATRESLAALADTDPGHTLTQLTSGSEGDAERTASYSVGTATNDGERFRILRLHASGGLGAVFVALDTELNREVALKQILELHADDPTRRQRFLVEAEVTGGLEHPGIVPVYSLGTYADGRPYYAMRFIRGESLKEAIDRFHSGESLEAQPGRRSLEFRNLLRRFLDVCNAIEYAHSRGVLHRDIKPGNIVVGRHGETLVVDWGLAKPLGHAEPGHDPAERTLMPHPASGSAETLPGSALGTPAYMSPEQAEGALDRLGPRSDVYSLGATLYCLLIGKAAFEGEVGDVLKAVHKGDFLPPREHRPSIDKALDAICLKAMATGPQDRYGSARALGEEIERWMADEPVVAYAEPIGARARRWARRHHTAVVSSAWLLVASVIGLSAGLALLRAKQRETEVARANAVTNYGDALRAHRAADVARRDAETNFARAMDAVETMLVRVSQKHLVNLPHFEPVRRQLLEDALAFNQEFLARSGGSQAVVLQAARAYRFAGVIHRQLGQRALARQELAQASDLLRRLAESPERDLELAAVHHARAEVATDDRLRPEAIDELRRGLAVLGPLQEYSLEAHARRALLTQEAESQSLVGSQLSFQNQFAEARDAFRRARSVLEHSLAADPLDESSRYRLSTVENNEAILEILRDDRATAVEHLRRAIRLQEELLRSTPDAVHYRRDQANSSALLATSLGRLGRVAEGFEAGRRAIDLFARLAADYPTIPEYRFQVAASHHNLATALAENGRFETARGEFLLAIEALGALIRREPGNPAYVRDMANSHMWLGSVERSLRRYDESARQITRASDLFAEAARLRPNEPDYRFGVAAAEHNRAWSLELAGRLDLADQGFRRSQQVLGELLAKSPGNPLYLRDLASSTAALGQCLLACGEQARGFAELTRALELCDGLLSRSPSDANYLENRGRVLILLGRLDDASRVAESLASLPDPEGKRLYTAACVLASNLSRPGRDPLAAARVIPDRVDYLADRAMTYLTRAVTRGFSDRAQIETEEELDGLRARADFPAVLDLLLDRGFPVDPFATSD
jgi:serine/threonine-protein kinase